MGMIMIAVRFLSAATLFASILTMAKLSIAHWNDVYRVTPLKFSAKSAETIDVSQFSSLLNTIRGGWKDRSDGTRDGLSFFSGDLFSPSVESTVTRGSHMVRSDKHDGSIWLTRRSRFL